MLDNPVTRSALFANVSGNARLHEKLGSTEALRAVDRCLKRMERAVTAFGGDNVKTIGSELMAVFARADDAYYAAIEMQARVADLPPVSGVQLAIRVGFSHGPFAEEGEDFRGESVEEAVYLAGLARPGQILTNLRTRSTLSPALKKSTKDLGPAIANGPLKGITIFEATAPEATSFADTQSGHTNLSPGGERQAARLCLRYENEVIVLDDLKKEIRMGRDSNSDVVIHDRRGSRHHARIERRGNTLVLIDQSTNGTYVTFNGKPELFLRREECVLRDKGLLCFAAPSSSPDADFADFEII